MSNEIKALSLVSGEMQEAITNAAQLKNAITQFVKQVMIKEQDYGTIPGVAKPSLYKPGAEKLMNLFSMRVKFECTDKVIDFERNFLSFSYRCTVVNKNAEAITECEGSCNTYEPKYRYTWAEKEKPAQAVQDEMKTAGTGKFKKGSAGWLWVERVSNPDTIGLQNTIQKMAQKRAFVGAMLIATNASEFFTQDVEDMGFIDVEATIVDDTPVSHAPQPATINVAKPEDTQEPPPQKSKKADAINTPTDQALLDAIPQETKDVIKEATDVAAIYLIHKNCSALHSNNEFIKMCSRKKAEIRKSVAI